MNTSTPAIAAGLGVLGATTHRVLRRMEADYARGDDRYAATVHRWFGRTTHDTKEHTDG